MKSMKMTQKLLQWMFAGVGMVVLSYPIFGRAATANVSVGVGGNIFTPPSTNINVGDRVLWTWAGGITPHNVTSTNSAWAMSPTQASGKFTNTFSAAGVYFYYCTIHGTPTTGMRGEILVIGANVPPTVTLTNPASGAVFAAPANVTLQAAASDGDGTVTNVQFRVDGNVVGNDTTAPYSGVANNLAAGNHTLEAVASDNSGAKNTNSVSITVVTPVAVQLSAPQSLPAAKFKFTYTANTGLSYIVQRSINFTDQNATVNPAFYRVGLLPNP